MSDVCVIFNPRAGRGKSERTISRLRRILGQRAEFWPTHQPGHAEQLAAIAASRFSVVAAAGGDGTVHEVANGLLSVDPPQATLAVLPVGSANDYAYSLGLDEDWWTHRDEGVGVRAVDVGLIRAVDGRQRWFINCLGIGFNGHVTRQARRIKSVRGIPLYGLAVLRAMISQFRHPVLSIRLDDGEVQKVPTLALTFGLGQREGNFLLTPNAILDDGLFDYLHVGRLSRWGVIRYVPRMIMGRVPTDDPVIGVGRCRRVEVECEEPLMVHADGEFFCEPEEDVRRINIELYPGRLRVMGRTARP
jgi:YegS/Rv2252/BmrU family lipid kinase